MNTKNTTISFIITLISVIALIASFFLPYASVSDERREILENHPDEIVDETTGMTSLEIADMSIIEYGKVYFQIMTQGKKMDESVTRDDILTATIDVVIIALIVLFTVLLFIFVLIKKPIALMIFSIFDFGLLYLYAYDHKDRGAIGEGRFYDFGYAYYMFYGALIVLFISAIWMLVLKIKNKKAAKISTSEA